MKRAILFWILALTLSCAAAAQSRVTLLDRIVAVVNDEVITQIEIEQQKKEIIAQLSRQGTPLPPADVLEKQVLERAISDRAQLQFAKESGIRADDAQVERAIARIAEDNKLSMSDFRKALEKDGVPFAKFREEIRNEIILTRLREREVENRVVVTDGEIDNFLATAKSGREDDYQLAHILVLVPEQASPEQIQLRKARAEEALRNLRSGADFAQTAATFSDANDALQGGALGWRAASRLPSLFADAVKQLKPGQVSGILKSANGFHIVKLLEQRGKDSPLVIEQTRTRHLLIRVNEIVSEAEAKTKIDRLKDRLNRGGDFAELAKLNSEDPSASRSGDLGWLSPGDTVPEFERAMNNLAANQISEPIRSPFGWHLIQVLERRKQDVTAERTREQARAAIRARKADEAYQDWLRQLRDRSYVEYRSDDK